MYQKKAERNALKRVGKSAKPQKKRYAHHTIETENPTYHLHLGRDQNHGPRHNSTTGISSTVRCRHLLR